MIVYSTFNQFNNELIKLEEKKLFTNAFEEDHYDDRLHIIENEGNSIFDIYQNVFYYIASFKHFTISELKLLTVHRNLPYLINYINFLAKEDGYWFYELKEKLLRISLSNCEYETSYSECDETGGDIIYIQTPEYQFSYHNFDMKNYAIENKQKLRYKTRGKDLIQYDNKNNQINSILICKERLELIKRSVIASILA